MGHVRDLPKGNGAIDIENNFKPTYEVSPEKKDVIAKVALMPVENLPFIHKRASIIRNILDAVATRLKAQDAATLTRLGYKTIPGKDTSYVPGENIKALCEELSANGIPEEEIWKCLSPNTEALNTIAHTVRGGSQKAAKEWVKLILGKHKIEQRGEPMIKDIE